MYFFQVVEEIHGYHGINLSKCQKNRFNGYMSKHKLTTAPKPLDLDVRPGQSVELLKELHILTREGKLNQDSRRKLKQVYHLFQFIEKLLKELPASDSGPTLADHGAGKSYLGFIIYDLFFKALGRGAIYGIETLDKLGAEGWKKLDVGPSP